MLGGTVTLEYEGEPGARIAVITISSPEVRNALTPGMGRDLVALCDRIDADDQVISAVIRGANGTFCSGGDTREWTVISDAASDEAYRSTSAVYESFARFGRLSVPSIAAIRGAAVGAGLNIALAADLRICAEDARLIAGFGQIGIHPGGGFFALLGRTGSREAAAAVGLFNQELSGRRAVEAGLAWEALPDAEVEARALDLARQAVPNGRLGRITTRSFRLELGPPAVSLAAALELERGNQMWSQSERIRFTKADRS